MDTTNGESQEYGPTEAATQRFVRIMSATSRVQQAMTDVIARLDCLGAGNIDATCEALRVQANDIKQLIAEDLADYSESQDAAAMARLMGAAAEFTPLYLAPMSCLSDMQESLELARMHDAERPRYLASAYACAIAAKTLLDAWLPPTAVRQLCVLPSTAPA